MQAEKPQTSGMNAISESRGGKVPKKCPICQETKKHHSKRCPDGSCFNIEIANGIISADCYFHEYGSNVENCHFPTKKLKTKRFAQSGRRARRAIAEANDIIMNWVNGGSIPLACYSYLASFHETVLRFVSSHYGLSCSNASDNRNLPGYLATRASDVSMQSGTDAHVTQFNLQCEDHEFEYVSGEELEVDASLQDMDGNCVSDARDISFNDNDSAMSFNLNVSGEGDMETDEGE